MLDKDCSKAAAAAGEAASTGQGEYVGWASGPPAHGNDRRLRISVGLIQAAAAACLKVGPCLNAEEHADSEDPAKHSSGCHGRDDANGR